MKKFSFFAMTVVAVLLTAAACQKDKTAYYQFTPLDNQRLLPYKQGQVLTFANQNNKERTFSVSAVDISKESVKPMGSLDVYFYYDTKTISLIDSETGRFAIYFNRYPLDVDLAKKNRYTKHPSVFYARIGGAVFWNGLNMNAAINYEQKKTEMIVNEKTYKDVFVIASGNYSIIEFKPRDEIYYMDVNVIYYDEKEGIIGFDDLNNNKWRLIN